MVLILVPLRREGEGSRVQFICRDGDESYIMHKPHPSNIIKMYVLKQMLTYFKEHKFI